MKTSKKVLSLVLCAAMVLALSFTTFAASIDEMTVSDFQTSNSDTGRAQDLGHVYVGYAITDGAQDEANSNWTAEDPANIVFDDEVEGEGFTALRAEGEQEINVTGTLTLKDTSDGQYASDFTGTGVAITGYNGTVLNVKDMTYYSEGFSRSFAIVQNASLIIEDSEITAMGRNPLTESYDGYYNSANTSMMISPPWVLGIQGGIRTINVLGTGSNLVVADSDITAGGWGVLSSDGCTSPYFYLFNTTLEILPASEGGMNSGWAILGYDENAYGSGYGTYLIGGAEEFFYGTTIKGATYASILTGGDGFYQGMKAGETYEALDATTGEVIYEYTAEEDIPMLIETVFGFMAHNSGSINVLEGTVVNSAASIALYKSADSTWTFDGCELNPGNGIIFQMIDNDDSSVGGFNPFGTYLIEEEGVPTEAYEGAASYVFTTDTAVDPAKTYYTSDTTDESGYAVVENPTDEGTVAYYEKATGGNQATVNFANGEYAGDIFNATGYYAQAPDALTVNIADTASLIGDIALTSHVHGIEIEGKDLGEIFAPLDEANAAHEEIGGYYEGLEDISYVFLDAEGEVIGKPDDAKYLQFTQFSTAEYYLLGQVVNFINYNGASTIDVYVDGCWTVEEESLITYLEVAEGAEVYAELIENEDGSLTLIPSSAPLAAGTYGKAYIYVEPAASEGGQGGGESAEAEGEGESAEEAASEGGEGESAEEAAGDDEAIGKQQEELEITYNGVTGMALYEDTVDGTSEKRGFQITFDGKVYAGGIDKGVWVADNEEDQGLIDAYQAAHESQPGFVGH